MALLEDRRRVVRACDTLGAGRMPSDCPAHDRTTCVVTFALRIESFVNDAGQVIAMGDSLGINGMGQSGFFTDAKFQ